MKYFRISFNFFDLDESAFGVIFLFHKHTALCLLDIYAKNHYHFIINLFIGYLDIRIGREEITVDEIIDKIF